MKESHFLRCDFSAEELREFSRELARKTAELSQAEEDKKAAVSQFADRIAANRADTSRLARNINSGYEMRMTVCEVLLNTPVTGTARIVRSDTGEVVKERAMTGTEMQGSLELSDAGSVMEKVADGVVAAINAGALDRSGVKVTATKGKAAK